MMEFCPCQPPTRKKIAITFSKNSVKDSPSQASKTAPTSPNPSTMLSFLTRSMTTMKLTSHYSKIRISSLRTRKVMEWYFFQDLQTTIHTLTHPEEVKVKITTSRRCPSAAISSISGIRNLSIVTEKELWMISSMMQMTIFSCQK